MSNRWNVKKYHNISPTDLANASDSEQTASLFVNNYDANEFNLTASDSVSIDDAPSHEELGDVLFGGFEV